MTIRPRRSALYMPGSNARAIEKAKSLETDVVIFDLEDAVAPDAKQQARDQVKAAVQGGGYGRREVVVRVNGLDSAWIGEDVAAFKDAGADALLVPKVESGEHIERVEEMLADAPAGLGIWAMIETPLAIVNVAEIARTASKAGGRLKCFVVGTNDLVKDTRAELDDQRTPALYWLSATVTAARAFGIDVLDGVYNDFKDLDGLARECAQGRMLGMDGKTLIHPTQLDAANDAFSPSDEEIAWARRILEAFTLPENQGKGVINMDGRMVELLHAEMAKRTVAIGDAIGR